MKISSTNKKRSHDEVEQDGFKELLSVEEEDEELLLPLLIEVL